MAFGTNYEGIPTGGGLVPQGNYETIITNAVISQTKNGKYKVSFMLTIRNDIQQNCQNRVLFIDIWKRREPTPADEQVDGFNFAQLMNIAKAAAIPDGTNFESLADFLRTLVGRLLRVTVTHRAYGGRTYEEIDNLRGLSPTKFPDCRHVQKSRQQAQNPAYSAPAPRQPQQYAQQQTYQQPPMQQGYTPAPPPLQNANLSDFEEILQDGQLPF